MQEIVYKTFVWSKFSGPRGRGQFGKLHFCRYIPKGAPNLVQRIVSQTSSYIVCFNLYVQQFKSFILEGPFCGFTSWRTSRFGPNNCLTNVFLHCKFQLSMLSSSKVSFGRAIVGVCPLPRRTPNLVQTIVSQTTS